MDFNFFCRVTKEMADAGVEEIGLFFLGESTLNPDLLAACLTHCKEVLEIPYVFLTTNGTMLHPWVAEDLMRRGLDSLKFSVNSAEEQQYHKITQVSPKLHRKALDNLKKAREIRDAGGYRTRLYASSIQFDGEQAAKMETLLNEHVRPYVDTHYFLPLYGVMAKGDGGDIEEGFRPTAGNQGRIGALREPLPCWSAFREGHLTADGKLSACCFHPHDGFTMADLNEVDFMSGWNSIKFQELRKAHLAKNVTGTICESCVLY
jgi:hypothetical protein